MLAGATSILVCLALPIGLAELLLSLVGSGTIPARGGECPAGAGEPGDPLAMQRAVWLAQDPRESPGPLLQPQAGEAVDEGERDPVKDREEDEGGDHGLAAFASCGGEPATAGLLCPPGPTQAWV